MTGQWIVVVPGDPAHKVKFIGNSEREARKEAARLIEEEDNRFAYLAKVSVTFTRGANSDEPQGGQAVKLLAIRYDPR